MQKTTEGMYSREALQALQKALQTHRALIWVNPVTNEIDVKQIFDRADEAESPSGVSFV